jgi:hypothetical protein
MREGATVYSTSPMPWDKESIAPFAPSVQYPSFKTPSYVSGCQTGKSYSQYYCTSTKTKEVV